MDGEGRHPATPWQSGDFRLLWGGQAISQLGSEVTRWAIPLTAAVALRVTPGQMGLLEAVGAVPLLLLGLVAGAWVDRTRRRPLLVAADLGRAALIGSLPVAALLSRLALAQLYAVAFLAGVLAVVFDVAYQSFLPTLVAPERLVAANSALEASASVARVSGPGLAGILVQLLTGPLAILVDALSFLASATSLALIRAAEPPPAASHRPHLGRAIVDGLRAVVAHPLLRTLAVTSGLFNLFDSVLLAVYVLYLTRTIGVAPALVGVIFALGGVGGLLGALLTGPLTRRVGLGPALVGGVLLAGVAEVVIAVAGGPRLIAAALVAGGEASVQAGAALYAINGVSVRQALVPATLQGRVNATVRVIALGATPLGALVGGALGDRYGLRPTVLVAGVGTLCACLWIVASPVRRLREPARQADGSPVQGVILPE